MSLNSEHVCVAHQNIVIFKHFTMIYGFFGLINCDECYKIRNGNLNLFNRLLGRNDSNWLQNQLTISCINENNVYFKAIFKLNFFCLTKQ